MKELNNAVEETEEIETMIDELEEREELKNNCILQFCWG